MLSSLLVIVIVLAVGTRASDAIQVRQQEVILQNLPEREALAYYEILRKRVRKTAVLRVIALISLITLFYAYKHRLGSRAPSPPAPISAPTTGVK